MVLCKRLLGHIYGAQCIFPTEIITAVPHRYYTYEPKEKIFQKKEAQE